MIFFCLAGEIHIFFNNHATAATVTNNKQSSTLFVLDDEQARAPLTVSIRQFCSIAYSRCDHRELFISLLLLLLLYCLIFSFLIPFEKGCGYERLYVF